MEHEDNIIIRNTNPIVMLDVTIPAVPNPFFKPTAFALLEETIPRTNEMMAQGMDKYNRQNKTSETIPRIMDVIPNPLPGRSGVILG